ncbi:hypothetical protein DFH28DRAFT_1078488 [Melampsora americana]|nr:hypothetical protein DFH28DRAFT_1078488 [Melampsora americana]
MRKENELEENNGVGRTDDRSAKGNDVVMVDATTVDKDLAVNKSGQIATNEPTDMNPSKLIGEWKITLSEENALPVQTLQRIWSVMNEAVQLGLAIPISIPNHTQKKDDLKQATTDVQEEIVETLQPVASGSPEACGSVTPALSQSQPQTNKASKSSIVPESVKEKNGVALTKNIKDLKGSEDTLPKRKVVINETESLGDQIRRLSSQLPKPSTRDLLDLEDDEEKDEEESRMSDEPEDEDEDPQDHPSLKRSNARRYDSSEEEDDEEEEEVLPLNSVAEVRPDHCNVVSGVALNPTIISTGVQEDDEEEDEQEETRSTPHPQEVPIVQSAIALPHTDIFTQRSPQRPDIQVTQNAADMSSGVNQVNNSSPTFSKVESSQTVNAITNALGPEGEEGLGSLSDPGRSKTSRSDLSSLTMTKAQSIDSARETSTSHDSSLSPVLTATQSSPRKVHNKMIKPSNITTTKSPKSKTLSQKDSIVEAKDDTLSRIQDSPIDSSGRLSSHPPITTSRVQSSDEESGSEEETPNVMSTKLSNKLSSHHKFDSTMVGNHKPDSETDESSKSSETDKDSSRNRTSQIESHIPMDTPQLESSSSSSDEDSSSDEEADEQNPPPSAQKGKPSIQESFINSTHLSSRTQEMSQFLKENRPRGTRRKTLNSFKPDDFEISVLNQHKVLYPINEPIESDCSESESESDSSSSDSSEEDSEEKEKERKAKENLNGLPISKMAGEGEEKRKRKRKSMIEIWKLESAKMKRK